MNDKARIRVLLVDDQRLFVDSLRLVINFQAADIEVVGVAYDGREGLRLAEELEPDLVVMDVRMPVIDGVEATKIIREKHPSISVLMLTTFDDDEYVHDAIRFGAAGYLLKDLPPEDLIAAMRAATQSSFQFSPSVLSNMMMKAYPDDPQPQQLKKPEIEQIKSDLFINDFSQREREILDLVARDMNNAEIADMLSIALQTVKNRISDLYFKCEVHDRLHLIRLAKKMGFGLDDK